MSLESQMMLLNRYSLECVLLVLLLVKSYRVKPENFIVNQRKCCRSYFEVRMSGTSSLAPNDYDVHKKYVNIAPFKPP